MDEFGPAPKLLKILKSHTDIVQSPLTELRLFAVRSQCPEQTGDRFDDLTELEFAFPKGLLRRSPIINIDQDAIPTQHRAIAGSQWFSADLEPPISTVRSSNSAHDIVRISGFEICEPAPYLEPNVVRMDFIHPSPANDFAQRRSKIFEHPVVDVVEITIRRGSPHQRWNGFNYQTKLLRAVG